MTWQGKRREQSLVVLHSRQMPCTGASMQSLYDEVHCFFFFVVIHSDSNASGPDECCSAQVWQRSIEFYPHRCVSRPGLCLKVLEGTVLQQVLCCHWRCAAGAHCRRTNMKLGEHVISESAAACSQPHSDHLVFPRKEVSIHPVCCNKDVAEATLNSPTLQADALH